MLSKILTASTLVGSFGSRTNSAQSLSRVLELDALFSSLGIACSRHSLTLLAAQFQPFEYRLAAFDVLANFLRLSKFQSRVNLFFAFFEIFLFSQMSFTRGLNSHNTKISKHRNDRNLAAEHLAPNVAINCSSLGLDCR
jgi:hypothetical protein